VFLFQEGPTPGERAFRELARLTKGAYCRFDAGSAQLRELSPSLSTPPAAWRCRAPTGRGARSAAQLK
jgi:hypothetical protein